ncbi:hypothetical protein FB446DRAFT_791325 [Lentinula raphanica]|uniref:Uncharacterized protein n=1 Tax=Lentinula raphanica TaxID=153919 RepID=A0AA38UJ55_9AGAR|nr:hypothetical protein EV360DRAFT_81526 [Lentinula raphanica]KAJ3769510.1 hypothetical protein FB446DRAFT_791325 [Lentinula raphanica]KAJ3843672.1 hypothetical protein F5878DRAFT_656518 [Lentinula raphanica]
MNLYGRAIILCVLLFWAEIVPAVPTFSGQYSIGSLIPGLSSLQALREGHSRKSAARHLNVRPPNTVGNLTITTGAGGIPLFYIHRGRLWRYINETSIHAVNIINGTEEAPGTNQIPLQLMLEEKPGGIDTGVWKWKGTMLIYQLGRANNSGVYYDCMLPKGGHGLLTFLQG